MGKPIKIQEMAVPRSQMVGDAIRQIDTILEHIAKIITTTEEGNKICKGFQSHTLYYQSYWVKEFINTNLYNIYSVLKRKVGEGIKEKIFAEAMEDISPMINTHAMQSAISELEKKDKKEYYRLCDGIWDYEYENKKWYLDSIKFMRSLTPKGNTLPPFEEWKVKGLLFINSLIRELNKGE